jgi:hypothetical protein
VLSLHYTPKFGALCVPSKFWYLSTRLHCVIMQKIRVCLCISFFKLNTRTCPSRRRGMKLTIHLQLVPRSRKCGSIHPLPHTPSWRSAEFIKQRDFIYYSLLGPGIFFSFILFFYTDGRTPWTGDQPVAKSLPTYNTNTE